MLKKIQYDDIECGEALATEAIDAIRELITISNDKNLLYICHPRHVFENIEEDRETKVITAVDFDSLNFSLMTRYDDYGRFSILNQFYNKGNNQFTYLNKRFSNMLRKYRDKGQENMVYPLAIIEEERSPFDNSCTYVPRGIICAKQDGILVYNNVKENQDKVNPWQKTLQMNRRFY